MIDWHDHETIPGYELGDVVQVDHAGNRESICVLTTRWASNWRQCWELIGNECQQQRSHEWVLDANPVLLVRGGSVVNDSPLFDLANAGHTS